jgi:hypothetical protein
LFGIFRITKDANKAHSFIGNFVDFARETIGMFGIEQGFKILSDSEWAAGSRMWKERNSTFLNFRLCIPFSSFYTSIDNVALDGEPSAKDANIRIEAIDEFQGFGLNAYTDRDLVQVYALNRQNHTATARAAMLMARFKSRGATDISNILKGSF